MTSDDGTLAGDSALRRWSDLLVEASENLGRTLVCSRSYKKWLEEQGFINVVELIFKWPQNSWPKDKKYKELGECFCLASAWLITILPLLFPPQRRGSE